MLRHVTNVGQAIPNVASDQFTHWKEVRSLQGSVTPERRKRGLRFAIILPVFTTVALLFSSETGGSTAEAAGPQDCAGVIAAVSGGIPGWAAAAIAAPFCGAWLGEQNAAALCWASRQPWGWVQRAQVWALTFGHYSIC